MLAITKFRDDLSQFPVIGSARREHIDRWIEDPRVQEVWERLAAIAPDLEAKDFIHVVLMLRQRAASAVAQRKFYIEECNSWRAKYDKKLKRLACSRIPDLELAGQLQEVATGLQLNATILSFIPEVPDGDFSRQDKDGSRVRELFELELGRYFQDICGQWLDWEVAALTEIAFPGKHISEDMVRQMRQPSAKIQVNQQVPSNEVSIVPDQ
jgi:hypothetical protein